MGVDPGCENSHIGKSEVLWLDEVYPWFLSHVGVEFIVLSVWGVEMGVAVFVSVVVAQDFSPKDAQDELWGVQRRSQVGNSDVEVIQLVVSLGHH